MAAHSMGQHSGGVAQARPGRTPSGPHLIRGLRLKTEQPISVMRDFYEKGFGLAAENESADSITFAAGGTRVTFDRSEPVPGAVEPFYHFAFNIPRNKLLAAREWLLERTPLIKTPPNLRDPAYPDDVRHFRGWNAHSLFFWDPAHNIVEFIARHTLDGDAPGGFTPADILHASEIGLMVERPTASAEVLHERLGLHEYPRGDERWWAMGDERGLLLCLLKGRIWGDDAGTSRAFAVYPTEVTIHSGPEELSPFDGLPYTIRAER